MDQDKGFTVTNFRRRLERKKSYPPVFIVKTAFPQNDSAPKGEDTPPRNFEILDCRGHIFLHFEVYFYFALLFLKVNQFEQIWREKKTEHLLNSISERRANHRRKEGNMISKFDHRKLALSVSSTDVGQNRYRSISLILTLEQNILRLPLGNGNP